MKKLALALVLSLLAFPALAQSKFTMPPPGGTTVVGVQVVTACGAASGLANGNLAYLAMDTTGVLCTSIGGGGITAAVTVADGADIGEGGTTAAAATAGGVGSVNAKLRLMTTQLGTINTTLGSPLQAGGTAVATQGTSPWVTGTAAADPCQANVATYTPISITSATTTRIVAPTSSKRTYVCYMFLLSAIANNVAIVEGTGGTCGASTAGVVGGTTAANGINLAANSGAVFQAGGNVAIATAGTNVDLCLITSAIGPIAGHIKWVQAP